MPRLGGLAINKALLADLLSRQGFAVNKFIVPAGNNVKVALADPNRILLLFAWTTNNCGFALSAADLAAYGVNFNNPNGQWQLDADTFGPLVQQEWWAKSNGTNIYVLEVTATK